MPLPIISKKLVNKQEDLFSLGATLSRACSRFLLVFLASYLLSKYEFGIFNIFLSIYFFARLFSENSLNLPFIKFYADGQNDSSQVTYQIILLKILYIVIVSFFILLGSGFIVEYTGLERQRLLLFLPFILFALTSYMFVGQVLTAQIRMRLLFIYEFLHCCVFVLFTGFAYYFLRGFSTVTCLFLFGSGMATAALAGGIMFKRFIIVQYSFNRELFWQIIHYSKFTVLSGISSLVILKADVLMLGFFLGPRDVGIYGMALFVNEAVNIIFDSVLRIFLPKASALSTEDYRHKARQLYYRSAKNIYIGIFPIIIIIALAGPYVIEWFYEGKFNDSIPLIYWFLAASLIKPYGYVAGVMLGATGHIRIDNRNTWIIAILNVVCNVVLIPRFGVSGAAAASFLSFACLTLINYVSVQKLLFSGEQPDNIK